MSDSVHVHFFISLHSIFYFKRGYMTFKIRGGVIPKTEVVPRNGMIDEDSGIQDITETSDVAQTIRELNDDSISPDKFSAIDMKTRLESVEIGAIIALDTLVSLNFLPENASKITRSKKRLAVSRKGLGRQEIVQVAQGLRDKEQGKNAFDRLGTLFGGNK